MKFIRKSELLLKDYWEVHFVQAKIMYQLKMYTNAAEEIKFAHKLNNNERIINLWAGRIFFKCGEYDKSEKHFNDYIENESSVSTGTQLEFIDVLQKQKKLSEALKQIEDALSLDPGNSDILEKKRNLSGNIQLK
jgi:tetratricopeptide (TPR) repeat protein